MPCLSPRAFAVVQHLGNAVLRQGSSREILKGLCMTRYSTIERIQDAKK